MRPEDYAAFKRSKLPGRLRMYQVGVSLDPDVLWFNLGPGGVASPGRALLARKEFRQAISLGVDRQAIADGVYLGAAVPIFGPITPGNAKWYAAGASLRPTTWPGPGRSWPASASVTATATACSKPPRAHPPASRCSARPDTSAAGPPRRCRQQLRQLGLKVDLVGLDPHGIVARFGAGDYDSIYFATQASAPIRPSISTSGSVRATGISGTRRSDALSRVGEANR